MPDNHDPVLERLRGADPANRLTADDDTLSKLLADSKRLRPARRRRLVIGVGLIGVLAVGVAAPAAADVVRAFLAQTGTFGNAAYSEEDSSEWIDLLAPDARDYIASIYPEDLPVPPGTDLSTFRLLVADKIIAAAHATSEQEGGVAIQQQRTGLMRSFESTAYQEWIRTWLIADQEGDTAGRDAATVALQDACTWSAFVATDGGGVIARMQTFADAAKDGDREGVQAAAQYNLVEGAGGWDGVDRDWWITEHTP
jgi:hypothetical protein